MTEDELAALVEGIAPVVRDFVTQAVADLALHQTATNTHLRALLDAVHDIGPMRERLAVLETRAPVPGLVETIETDLTPLLARLAATEARLERITLAETALADLGKELVGLRERAAVLETRAPVPGPSGSPGRDGADGVGFDDLTVEHDGERAFTVKCVRGDVVKVLGTFRIPAMIYRDVWTDGRTYEPGDVVTWARSTWHCKKTTTLKPDGVSRDGPQAKDFWTLIVARGRDGKDGKDGPPGPQGPAGRDWQQVYDDTRRR